MRVLVIGGTAFIGRHIVAALDAAGHEVVLFNRGKTNPDDGHRTITGDVRELVKHGEELRAVEADAVIHCIAYTPKHAADFVEVFGRAPNGSATHTPTRAIVLSSQDCYEAFRQLVLGNGAGVLPITEDSPTSEVEYYWSGTD